jgi:hypothetical protein
MLQFVSRTLTGEDQPSFGVHLFLIQMAVIVVGVLCWTLF